MSLRYRPTVGPYPDPNGQFSKSFFAFIPACQISGSQKPMSDNQLLLLYLSAVHCFAFVSVDTAAAVVAAH